MNKEIKVYPKIGAIYKHYRGGHYKVLYLAKHTETGEDMIVYQSIEFGSIYTRPLDIWDSPTGLKRQDLKTIDLLRFTYKNY